MAMICEPTRENLLVENLNSTAKSKLNQRVRKWDNCFDDGPID